MADDDEAALGSRDGDVEPPLVRQEADGALSIAAYRREDDRLPREDCASTAPTAAVDE